MIFDGFLDSIIVGMITKDNHADWIKLWMVNDLE
jgi:hypothetical protein